jgi:hypothetical protein
VEIEKSIMDLTIKLPPTMVVEGQIVKGHQLG